MFKIPLCRVLIEKEEFQAVEEVLKSGWLTHGPRTTEFENLFAEYIGVKHAVAMNSCTSALFLALASNEIKGEVLVPSFTFVASANAIKTAGATPVFVDINYDDCNVNPDHLESQITPRVEAVMMVHYAGQCCDMDRISAIAEKHNLLLIEDSAETIGGTNGGKKSGSWGIGCYSFFPTKNITTGEGGMLTTNNDELAAKMKALISHGIFNTTNQREECKKSWERAAIMPGYNYRLSNILAAIGVEQMKKVDAMNEKRRQHSAYLMEKLKDVQEIALPYENENCKHVYQMFTIKVKKGSRNKLVVHLRERGIEASVHFDPPVHLHPAYEEYKDADLPVTCKVARSILTLPMYPLLTKVESDYIVDSVTGYFTNG